MRRSRTTSSPKSKPVEQVEDEEKGDEEKDPYGTRRTKLDDLDPEAVSGHDSIPADSFNLPFIVLLFSVQER